MKNLLSAYTLSVLLISTLLTACGNSEEETPKPAPIASAPTPPAPVKKAVDTAKDTNEKEVMSNDELDKLMKEFEGETELKPKTTQIPTTQPKIKSSPKVANSGASHDSLTHDEIKSLEGSVGLKCRTDAESKLNLSGFGVSDDYNYKDATYIGNNTYQLQQKTVIFNTEDEVEFVCTAVASGDSTFMPDWDISVKLTPASESKIRTSAKDKAKQKADPNDASGFGAIQKMLLLCKVIDQAEFNKRRSGGMPDNDFAGFSPAEFAQHFDKGVSEANAEFSKLKDKEKECKDLRELYGAMKQFAEGFNNMAEDLKEQGWKDVEPK